MKFRPNPKTQKLVEENLHLKMQIKGLEKEVYRLKLEREGARFIADKYTKLRKATVRLYYAGHWTCDRPVDEDKIWRALRDVLELPEGASPEPVLGVRHGD